MIREAERLDAPLLDDEVDVPQGHVLQLGFCGEQGDQRGRQLLQQGPVIVQVFGEHLHELHEHLDGGQDHGGVSVRQPRGHPLADTEGEGGVGVQINTQVREDLFNLT